VSLRGSRIVSTGALSDYPEGQYVLHCENSQLGPTRDRSGHRLILTSIIRKGPTYGSIGKSYTHSYSLSFGSAPYLKQLWDACGVDIGPRGCLVYDAIIGKKYAGTIKIINGYYDLQNIRSPSLWLEPETLLEGVYCNGGCGPIKTSSTNIGGGGGSDFRLCTVCKKEVR
jgi:hypothetical protein